MQHRWLRISAVVTFAAIVSGCATGYLLDNQVQSFSGLPAQPADLRYRFDRLPSQALQPSQNQVEALADPALFRAGFRRDDAGPRYAVQVAARVQQVLSPWQDPWDGWGWGGGAFGFGGPRFGPGFGFGGPFHRMEQPWFQREVSVVVREIASHKVVYETRASNEGPWLDNATALGAMFDAALQGFPMPPQGPRRVDVQLGGRQQQAAGTVPAASIPGPPAPVTAPAASPR